jgi:hypothetical protein
MFLDQRTAVGKLFELTTFMDPNALFHQRV